MKTVDAKLFTWNTFNESGKPFTHRGLSEATTLFGNSLIPKEFQIQGRNEIITVKYEKHIFDGEYDVLGYVFSSTCKRFIIELIND